MNQSKSPDSDTLTESVRVQAAARFVPDESSPDDGHFMFAYRIVITNEGEEPIQLLSRHWVILDADNNRQDVRGPGVVGEQPKLSPGESFEYVSGCPLPTSWGTMEGSYTMQRESGERFEAAIGRFFLVAPRTAYSH